MSQIISKHFSSYTDFLTFQRNTDGIAGLVDTNIDANGQGEYIFSMVA